VRCADDIFATLPNYLKNISQDKVATGGIAVMRPGTSATPRQGRRAPSFPDKMQAKPQFPETYLPSLLRQRVLPAAPGRAAFHY
jgi:hypothetical protein